MKQKWKIALSLFFALVFALQGLAMAFAADTETPEPDPGIEEFVNINNYNCYCSISGLTLYASASLTSKSSMYLQIKMELQKLSDGTYGTIKTWSSSRTGLSLDMDESKLINVFSTYRIKVTFTAGSESVVTYAYA